ncbi:hypothetical protein ACJIZ3_008946 [Penstemon smallii]|uniref:BHLH domain-containing protein n=1 Tax=Penstemon smallii TaxID=265156 RepID=A0ABD3TBZ7_9LAMI
MDGESLSEFFGESEFSTASDDIFSILEALENASDYNNNNNSSTIPLEESPVGEEDSKESFEFQKSAFQESDDTEVEAAPNSKRQKLINGEDTTKTDFAFQLDGQQLRMSHITVERNRRKQMNENLTVLRSLMPCFYVKRGDQASIIGGVVDYIKELQQVLQSLEAKKQRKTYTDVLSPRIISSPRLSPRPSPLSPRKPPLSPRLSLPISPRTPQSSSPYKPKLSGFLNSPSLSSPVEHSPCNSSTSSINDTVNELVACSKSAVAEVEVKFSGPNLMLKTVSHRIPGQALKIISALEELALEILQVNINTVDETMLNSFTIKTSALHPSIQQTLICHEVVRL